MRFELQFFGATGEVTGSMYVLRTGTHTVMLECGLIQGRSADEQRNRQPLPVPPGDVDAVILSSKYRHLYGARLFGPDSNLPDLPNFHEARTSRESMAINEIESGAIIIAGSGMCSGGRMRHHLKHNIWRPECHLVIVGYQANGTLGRRIVDGAETIRLWGDEYRVRMRVHTIGGLSAHADQADLVDWYRCFADRPPVYLIHGEPEAQRALASQLHTELDAPVSIPEYGQRIKI